MTAPGSGERICGPAANITHTHTHVTARDPQGRFFNTRNQKITKQVQVSSSIHRETARLSGKSGVSFHFLKHPSSFNSTVAALTDAG